MGKLAVVFLMGAGIGMAVLLSVIPRPQPQIVVAKAASTSDVPEPVFAPQTEEEKPIVVQPAPRPVRLERERAVPLRAPAPEVRRVAQAAPPPIPNAPVLDYTAVKPAPTLTVPIILPAPPVTRQPRSVTLQSGTMLSMRLNQTLSSVRLRQGDRFSGTLDAPLVIDGLVIAEHGSQVEGEVVDASPGTGAGTPARLVIVLTRVNTADGQRVPIRTHLFRVESNPIAGAPAEARLPAETRLSFSVSAPVRIVERL